MSAQEKKERPYLLTKKKQEAYFNLLNKKLHYSVQSIEMSEKMKIVRD